MGSSPKKRGVQPGEPKQCAKCKAWLPFTPQYFMGHRQPKRGLLSHCRSCHVRYEQQLAEDSKARWMDKIMALQAYGGQCTCCGETEPVFLTFDHMVGGGSQHRRDDPQARRNMGTWLIKHHYPGGYRILCFNCHKAIQVGPKHLRGICPHTLCGGPPIQQGYT